MSRLLLGVLLLAPVTTSAAGRPPEALLQEKLAAEAEVQDLERRARSLDEQAAGRNQRLKRRLRALYKLSAGGYLRLLAGAEDPSTLEARQSAVGRVLKRDLDELQAVRDEARSLDEDHARHAEGLARSLALTSQVQAAQAAASSEPPGLQQRMGRLLRPVPGAVVRGFGVANDPELKEKVSRRGADLESHRGEAVRAAGAGHVAWIGEVPGIGRGVAVDHGDGYVTLTARLRSVKVGDGEELAAGAVLGEAGGRSVYFELAQGGTPVDPAPWLAR